MAVLVAPNGGNHYVIALCRSLCFLQPLFVMVVFWQRDWLWRADWVMNLNLTRSKQAPDSSRTSRPSSAGGRAGPQKSKSSLSCEHWRCEQEKETERLLHRDEAGIAACNFYPIYSAEDKKHNGNQCCELQALEKDVRITVFSSNRSAPENPLAKLESSCKAGVLFEWADQSRVTPCKAPVANYLAIGQSWPAIHRSQVRTLLGFWSARILLRGGFAWYKLASHVM